MSASPHVEANGSGILARCTDGGDNDGKCVELTCSSTGALNLAGSLTLSPAVTEESLDACIGEGGVDARLPPKGIALLSSDSSDGTPSVVSGDAPMPCEVRVLTGGNYYACTGGEFAHAALVAQHVVPLESYEVVSVTPADGADLADPQALGLWCAVGGTVAIITPKGTEVTLTLVANIRYPFACARVLDTGTTATGILALYPS